MRVDRDRSLGIKEVGRRPGVTYMTSDEMQAEIKLFMTALRRLCFNNMSPTGPYSPQMDCIYCGRRDCPNQGRPLR